MKLMTLALALTLISVPAFADHHEEQENAAEASLENEHKHHDKMMKPNKN